jgi:hypothetical protein
MNVTRTPPTFCFLDRVVMSPETFESLQIVCNRPEATATLPPRTIGRALIERDGRTCWHAVEWQCSFGRPVHFASEIVVRVYAAEPA